MAHGKIMLPKCVNGKLYYIIPIWISNCFGGRYSLKQRKLGMSEKYNQQDEISNVDAPPDLSYAAAESNNSGDNKPPISRSAQKNADKKGDDALFGGFASLAAIGITLPFAPYLVCVSLFLSFPSYYLAKAAKRHNGKNARAAEVLSLISIVAGIGIGGPALIGTVLLFIWSISESH